MREDRSVEQKTRGVALQMTFEGDPYVPDIVGEKQLPGHHNYFLGNDQSCWRTHVPLYSSVRYEELYPGIDVRLRQASGVPEYDLLLQPGANLSLVRVHVEGGQGLSIAKDGSLVIQTELGPVTQPKPKTWTVDADGSKHEVPCHFTLLGTDRFGFKAPGWDGGTSLNIDPPLIWSTFLGGSGNDAALALSVDASGVVTVAGATQATGFPTIGTYVTKGFGKLDAFVSRLDPRNTGTAQLVYSTFLGGSIAERATALFVDASGVVTVAGGTASTNFPTKNPYNGTHGGGNRDAWVARLDPSLKGTAQLVYSTFLGGTNTDQCNALHVNASGVMTMAGTTWSGGLLGAFPTTPGAFQPTYAGQGVFGVGGDGFVSRLDPSLKRTAQLVYSTFLGGDSDDSATCLSVDAKGVVTVAGFTFVTSKTPFPTTPKSYSQTHNGPGPTASTPGGADGFVTRLDPNKPANAQLLYSTFLGGNGTEAILGLSVDAKSGHATVAGWTTSSTGFPVVGAYDPTYNGPTITLPIPGGDAFVTRLIPQNLGNKVGVLYSTYLGGAADDFGVGVSVDANGVVTLTGSTFSKGFPTTVGAYKRTLSGTMDALVTRLDPKKIGNAQLVYSTFLGGSGVDFAAALSVDASGVVTVAGCTDSSNFPTTNAYDPSYNFGTTPPPPFPNPRGDAFISRLEMGVALYGDVHQISISAGGTQKLTVNAGMQHAGRFYWILGSVTGTTPGITLLGMHFPLNPDPYTDITIGSPTLNPPFVGFTGKLDGNGQAAAALNVPKLNTPLGAPITFNHAYLVYDAQGVWHMVSNPVPMKLVR